MALSVGATMTSYCFPGHSRLLILLVGAMLLTPTKADDVTVAALNRAAVKANCPEVDSRQNAVRATMCRMNATRPVLAEHAPATLPAFDKMAARNSNGGALLTFAHGPNFKYRVAVPWFSEPDAP